MKHYTVSLSRRWNSRQSRWVTTYAASADGYEAWTAQDPQWMGAWQVRAGSSSEACGAVAEYLARGRPRYMDVTEKFWKGDDQ